MHHRVLSFLPFVSNKEAEIGTEKHFWNIYFLLRLFVVFIRFFQDPELGTQIDTLNVIRSGSGVNFLFSDEFFLSIFTVQVLPQGHS